MDMDKEVYHSNGMLGLIPAVEESESISFHFGKLLTTDCKDFFNCDTSIGLDYPVRSALQPICVHVDGSESTNWVNPPCDENVDLLDISSKRLPVDLGFNGLDKSSIHSSSNGNFHLTPNSTNNHVIVNSLPPSSSSDLPSSETTDYYYGNNQYNEIYTMRNDYHNHTPFVDNEKIYYNGNQSLYSNGYHSQHYDHPNHHLHNVHHLSPHQIYHNHQQPTTPLHHYQPQKRGQQPFQRHYTHRRRLNLYEKSSPSPIKHKQKQQQHQPQSPLQAQKPSKPPKPQKSPPTQRAPKSPKSPKGQQQRQKPRLQSPKPKPTPPIQPSSKPQQKIKLARKKQRIHVKRLEVKPELNQRIIIKKKIGRPRKYDYSPPKLTKFRSPRLRLRVQSEEANSENVQQSGDTLRSGRKVQVREREKKIKEVLPCDWIKPDNLTFDRNIVSDYEKTSLPEFFAGKFDRTHFHPSQYLKIRNIFLDEWEKRKPNGVHFREMIRIHKGIGNVVSFSRVCKFLTAIGAINETSQDEDDDDQEDNDDDDNINNNDTNKTVKKEEENDHSSILVSDENQSRQQDDLENIKDFSSIQPRSTSSSPPPSSSPYRETNDASSTTSSPPPKTTTTTQSEDKSSKPVTSRPGRKGRKRKSYFLNEMSRLGVDPVTAGFRLPGFDREEESEETPTNDNEDHNLPENVQNSVSLKA